MNSGNGRYPIAMKSADETQSGALPLSRREFFKGAGAAGVAIATSPLARSDAGPADGTPEQIHLTWGADPSRTVVLS